MRPLENDVRIALRRQTAEEQQDWLRRTVGGILRQSWIILICAVVAFCVGFLYVRQRPATFTAAGRLLVENTRIETGRQELLPQADRIESPVVDSQIEIIKSDGIAAKVVEALKLTVDPEFSSRAGGPGLTAQISNILFSSPILNPDPARVAVGELQRRLLVKRVGQTYVIEVAFRGSNPEQAATITNAVIDAYLADQAAASAAAAAPASAWLRERLKDLGPRTRIISQASPPTTVDGPRKFVLIAAFVMMGAVVGFCISLLRAAFDDRLRNPAEASALLGVRCVAAATVLRRAPKSDRFSELGPALEVSNPLFWLSVKRLRSELITLGTGTVLGITSSRFGEGASTITIALGRSLAAWGWKVLLIDANLYKADVSKQLAAEAPYGVVDVAAKNVPLADAIVLDAKSTMSILGLGTAKWPEQTFDAVLAFASTIHAQARNYDTVLIDLPPLAAEPDVGLMRNYMDRLLFVVEWGETSGRLARTSLSSARLGDVHTTMFMFNKVKRSALRAVDFPLESYASQMH